jgi:hypothetical protein
VYVLSLLPTGIRGSGRSHVTAITIRDSRSDPLTGSERFCFHDKRG